MRRNELPDTCFSVLPSTGQLIIIIKSESGYYPSEWDTGNREENRDIASSHNARRGITDIQEAAMLAGSIFGWNTPGANPQWYLDNAKYINSNIVQGHIKDPIMSVYYPINSFLIIDIKHTSETLKISYNTTSTAVKTLVELGILRETTNAARNRVFSYEAYLEILRNGT